MMRAIIICVMVLCEIHDPRNSKLLAYRLTFHLPDFIVSRSVNFFMRLISLDVFRAIALIVIVSSRRENKQMDALHTLYIHVASCKSDHILPHFPF